MLVSPAPVVGKFHSNDFEQTKMPDLYVTDQISNLYNNLQITTHTI